MGNENDKENKSYNYKSNNVIDSNKLSFIGVSRNDNTNDDGNSNNNKNNE